jgi:uncharacterized protein YjbI with pentapeptide repeats
MSTSQSRCYIADAIDVNVKNADITGVDVTGADATVIDVTDADIDVTDVDVTDVDVIDDDVAKGTFDPEYNKLADLVPILKFAYFGP